MGRDVTAFRERFKAYKNGKSVSEIYDAGLPRYAGGTPGLTKAQEAALDELYEWGNSLGYDTMSIAGIGGNGLQESGLNYNAKSKSGYAGLLQNNKNIQQAIIEQYGDYSPASQRQYIHDWNTRAKWITKGKHSPHTATNSGRYKTKGYASTDEASDAWMKLYERPVILDSNGKVIGYQEQDKRRAYTKLAYEYLNNKYGKPQVPAQEPSPYIARPVSTAVRPTIPAEQTVPAYDPTISPYISGKPMVKLRPRVQLPNLVEVMEDSEWEPGFPKLKNGKLPRYWKGTSGLDEDKSTQKAEQWADDWQFRLTPAARSKVVQKWNATGNKPEPESAEQYAKRRAKETEWKKPSGRKMLEMAPAVVDAVPIASDVKQALEAGAAALRQNYLEASLLSGGLLLPGLFKKTVKNSLKFLSKDELYKAAVERGDKQEALRLLEDAYLNSGVNKTPIVVDDNGHAVGWFHGSEWGNHTIFDSSAMNATIGGSSAAGKVKGNFLTTDLPSAKRYAGSDRYSTTEDPKTTTPNTFVEKLQNLFGVYQPRFLYPAERVGNYAPKPERLFDTHGLAPINHLDKTDNVVYPMYVNPGENPMVLDFNGKPWSQSPVQFPNNFYLKRYIRDDEAKTYRDVIIPFKDKETAMEAWMSDPINVHRGATNLDDKYFDEGIRSINAYNSTPRYEQVRLIEELVPNTTNGAVQTAAKEGNSSVLMKNVIDSNGGPDGQHYAIDDLATLKSEQMKLADITYDDAGNLIPLSKRFDWTNPDIRYMLTPFLIGGAGYGAYNRLSSYKNGKSPIHINPANRGKFTALKKRTGHSASWFKENGTPAQKKMAVFALNAKKWKH